MEGTLRQQAEAYYGAVIGPSEWDKAKAYAERKLHRIIEREGDADGARREPWYLAQLIAETVRADSLSQLTYALAELRGYAENEQFGVKKGQPTPESVSRPTSAPLL